MGYVVDPDVAHAFSACGREADSGVVDVETEVREDHVGESILALRVILRDSVWSARPSATFGGRLQAIATKLRRKAHDLGLPLFVAVDWVAQSEAEVRDGG